jgi:hypothetical protein
MKNHQIVAMSMWFALSGAAQVKTEVPPVIPSAKPFAVEHIQVHGAALEGNLENDAVDRDVMVFLPPSYATEKSRRYPVVYALHGYSIGAAQWSQEIHVPQTIEGALLRAPRHDCRPAGFEDRAQRIDVFSSVTTGDFSASSPTMWSPISMHITAPYPSGRAVVWWAIRWAVMARAGSA